MAYYSKNKKFDDAKFWTVRLPRYKSGTQTYRYNGRMENVEVHKFYNDHNREQTAPSWFIPHCSREQSEKILEQAVSLNYGNTMMRESMSHLSSGSYVISNMISKSNGSVGYDHYEVIRATRGYEIKVQNSHEPMRCLQDVMEYFISTSGRDTRPLTVNDLKRLGQETPGYATKIYTRQGTPQEEPWTWPPTDSKGPEPVPVGVYANYDQSAALPSNHGGHHDRATLSPGILRQRQSQTSAEGKSVVLSPGVTTPPPIYQHHTIAGTRTNHPKPPMCELAQRSREADQLNKLNTMISGFERGSIYANIEENKTRKNSDSVPPQHNQAPPAPPPPPPPPHVKGKQHYINQVSSPTASASTLRHASSFSSPPQTYVTKSSTQSTEQSVQFRKTATNSIASGTAQRKQVSKSMSEGQLRSTTSPNYPRNFPVWETNKQSITTPTRSTKVSTQTNKLEVFNETRNTADMAEAGVDEHTPGGVSTLRNKFEGNANTSATPQKQVEKRVQFSQKKQLTVPQLPVPIPAPNNRMAMRRKTEPALTDIQPDQFAGIEKGRLNPDFKNKLEDLFSGVGAGTVADSRARRTSVSPVLRQFSNEYHEYHELPDILPDAITYANDNFNANYRDNT